MFRRLFLSSELVVCAVGAACQVHAQSSPLKAPVVLTAPVVVTAARMSESIVSAIVPVTVITRTEIERSQATSLPQLLAGRLGIQIASNGGYGKTTSLFLRGTNSDQVLVLVNGVRFGSVTTGDAPWSQIPLSQIQRIEIVRGPLSSLYGSDAVGGVIQIFTRKPSQRKRLQVTAGVGSYGTRRASAGVSGRVGATGYSLTVSHFRTYGYDIQQNNVPSGYGYNTPNQPDADGFRNSAVSVWLSRRLPGGGQINGHIFRVQGQTQYDGVPANATNFINQVVGVCVRHPLTARWTSKLSVGESLNDNDNRDNGAHSSTFNSRIQTASWQNSLSLSARQHVIVGAEWTRQQVSSDTAFDRTRRHNVGLFAIDRVRFGRNRVQLSARQDRNSSYGSHGTGAIAWGYRFSEPLQLTASYGTAFDAPTFNDLYYPGFGNPQLGPEHSHSIDVGIHGVLRHGRWSVHVFRTDVRGLIVFVGPTFRPQNTQRARIDGLEASYRRVAGPWRLHVDFTVLNPRDQSTGQVLPRRSRDSGRLALNRQFGPLRVGVTMRARSASYDNAANTLRLGGYTVFDLRAAYRISHSLTVSAAVNNLFDKHYQTAYTYVQPGRTVLLNVRYSGV